MNKKAIETIPLGVIFGLIIGVIFVLILLNLSGKFLTGQKQEENVYFYFTKLGEDLTKMSIGDEKTSGFFTDKKFTLVTFNKDQEIIKESDLGDACTDFNINDIKKPVKCRDRNCLCLCKSNLDQTSNQIKKYPTFYTGKITLSLDCEAQESKCIELSVKVNSASTCKSFILYDRDNKLYNLNLKKDRDAFIINISKTL